MFPIVILGVLLTLCVAGAVRLIRGLPLIGPIRRSFRRDRSRLSPARRRSLAVAAVAAIVALFITGNLMVGLAVAGVIMIGPTLVSSRRSEQARLDNLEALAQWAEALRDVIKSGAGLETAIPATMGTVIGGTKSDALVAPLKLLSVRLGVKIPLPDALQMLAAEIDDASADFVVAALDLSALNRRGELSAVLTRLSTHLREKLKAGTTVMKEHNGVRRDAMIILVLVGIIVVSSLILQPAAVPGTEDTVETATNAFTVMLVVAFAWIFNRMRKLAEPEPEPRFLALVDELRDAAIYRPREVQL